MLRTSTQQQAGASFRAARGPTVGKIQDENTTGINMKGKAAAKPALQAKAPVQTKRAVGTALTDITNKKPTTGISGKPSAPTVCNISVCIHFFSF